MPFIKGIKLLAVSLLAGIVPAASLPVLLSVLNKTPINLYHFLRLWSFTGITMMIAIFVEKFLPPRGWRLGGTIAVAIFFLIIPLSSSSTWINGAMLCLWFSTLLVETFTKGLISKSARFFDLIMVLISFCTAPILYQGMLTGFADEEFYYLAQLVLMLVYFFCIETTYLVLKVILNKPQSAFAQPYRRIRSWLLWCLNLTLLITGLLIYQNSFYPTKAPTYPQIYASNPFICGKAYVSKNTYSADDVHARFIRLIASKPKKEIRDLGFLTLATSHLEWANLFRTALLNEAYQGLFTQPANSVKYGQYLASFRVYYYANIKERMPQLFSEEEQSVIQNWFGDINRRSLTIEWVDIAYALAFRYLPIGTYENQENGAGLIALLEHYNLAAPELRDKNQDYLAHQRGWEWRFRNTDDAIVYQAEWIDNAYFQSLNSELSSKAQQNLEKSFQWIMLQALPSGGPLVYNHLGRESFASIALLGAYLSKDQELIWLAGHALDYLERNQIDPLPHPGNEFRPQGIGRSPSIGSCLVFGDSGLPTRTGPLAPDKIVFRNGWNEGNLYLLLNLRFSGWHSYKATNSIILINNGEDILVEDLTGKPYAWLPAGRSLFRDKRIPRENLNGFIVEKKGLPMIMYQIIGFGSPWAQDVPHYAKVIKFEANDQYDLSTTLIEDWHGWNHWRTIYLDHAGLIIIYDRAMGNSPSRIGFTLHLPYGEQISEFNYRAGENHYARIVILPMHGKVFNIKTHVINNNITSLNIHPRARVSDAEIITIFFTQPFLSATVHIKNDNLYIMSDAYYKIIPLKQLLP